MTTLPHSASSAPIGSVPCATRSVAVATVIDCSVERAQLVAEREWRTVLPGRRRLSVHAIDGCVVARHHVRQLPFEGPAHRRSAIARGCEERIAPIKPGASFLVGLDPGWCRAGVLEQIVCERHLADVWIAMCGKRFAVEWQVLELAALLGFADQALGDALPPGLDDRTALRITTDGAHAALDGQRDAIR